MSWNPLSWFKRGGVFGRGSKVDALVRALPNAETVMRNTDAWALVLMRWGEAGVKWEPEDSRLIQLIKDSADALNIVGPLLDAEGKEKLAALTAKVRMGAKLVGMFDDAFDAWFAAKGGPLLEDYLAARR